MLAGAAAMRASLSEERAGQVSKKCEGDSTPRLQSLQVASPGVALVDLYLNLEASNSRPSQPVRSLILKLEGAVQRSVFQGA